MNRVQLGKHQRRIMLALRNGATLERSGNSFRLDGVAVSGDSVTGLYTRGYLLFDAGCYRLTSAGERAIAPYGVVSDE